MAKIINLLKFYSILFQLPLTFFFSHKFCFFFDLLKILRVLNQTATSENKKVEYGQELG